MTALDVARLGWDQPRHARRWSVRPGLVGMAQLYAGRGKRLSWFLDSYYVEHCGLVMNAAVVALSAAGLVAGKKRVRAWLRRRRRAACPAKRRMRTANRRLASYPSSWSGLAAEPPEP